MGRWYAVFAVAGWSAGTQGVCCVRGGWRRGVAGVRGCLLYSCRIEFGWVLSVGVQVFGDEVWSA